MFSCLNFCDEAWWHLKVKREYQKVVVRDEIEKSGMADYIWKEKGNNQLLLDEVKIIDRQEH